MRKDDCIFCKIVAGEIPSRTIHEDDLFKVILDLDPATKGHALIIPKNHFDDIYDLGDEEAKNVFSLAKKLTREMTDKLHADGFNIVQNDGEVAGQTVLHFHLHLIPRYENDGNEERLMWNHCGATAEDLDEVLEILK